LEKPEEYENERQAIEDRLWNVFIVREDEEIISVEEPPCDVGTENLNVDELLPE